MYIRTVLLFAAVSAGIMGGIVGAQAQLGYGNAFQLGYGPGPGYNRPIVSIGWGAPPVVFSNGNVYPLYWGTDAYRNYVPAYSAQDWFAMMDRDLPAGLQQAGSEAKRPEGDTAGEKKETTAAPRDRLYGSPLIPRTTDTVEAKIEKDGKLFIQWKGEPRAVSRVVFALLDKDKKPLRQQEIRRLPVETRFALTNKTAFYQVYIEYVNGTTTSIVSPL